MLIVNLCLQHGNGKFPDMGSYSKSYLLSPLYKPQKSVIGISEHPVYKLMTKPFSIEREGGKIRELIPFYITICRYVSFSIKHKLLITRKQTNPHNTKKALQQRSPSQCILVQASLTRKHDRSIVAGSGYAAWPVAQRLYQKLRNLLGEFCIDILMKNKMFTYVGYLNKHILKD